MELSLKTNWTVRGGTQKKIYMRTIIKEPGKASTVLLLELGGPGLNLESKVNNNQQMAKNDKMG